MKKLLILFAILLTVTSCNQKSKVQSENSEMKVPTAADIRKKEIQDSIDQRRKDSLALIAWGDVKFGMSMKEVLATEAFRGGERDGNLISMNIDKAIELEKALALNYLGRLTAKFEENELCRIYTVSYYVEDSDINKLVSECDFLIRNFTNKYGTPIYKKDRVNLSDFNSGEFMYSKHQIRNKTVIITLGKLTNIGYYYKLFIDNDNFPTKKQIISEKMTKKIRKQMEEAEKTKNNSF